MNINLREDILHIIFDLNIKHIDAPQPGNQLVAYLMGVGTAVLVIYLLKQWAKKKD